MENVGIYTPPKKVTPVAATSSDLFQPNLTQSDLEVTQSAQDKLAEIIDVVALNYLKGAQIDYIQEEGRERFVFNNVFAETGGTGACGGCGAAGG